MDNFIARNRINVSRMIFGSVIVLIFLTSHVWQEGGWLLSLMNALGFFMIIMAVFGRLWSSVFICGYKTKKVIQHGPYSVTRNPLYVFSSIGAVGFGLVTGSFAITAIIIFIYVVIYARTIIFEEHRLEEALGVQYLQYKANTPRFFPDFTLYKTMQEYTIKLKAFESAFKDAVWFFLGFGVLHIIGQMHESGYLPVLFRLP